MRLNSRMFWLLLMAVSFAPFANAQKIDQATEGHLLVKDIEPQMEFETIVKPYRDSLDLQMNRVIGTCDKLMVAQKPESSLSNLVADVLVWAINESATAPKQCPKVDFSLTNIKGIRSSISQGDIKVKNVYEILPFENTLVVMGLSGSQVVDLFNFIASQDGDGISGASFKMQDGKAFDCLVGGKRIKPKKIYYVVVPDYVANGGDRYTLFKNSVSRFDTDLKIRDEVICYIECQTRCGKTISPNLNRRIVDVK